MPVDKPRILFVLPDMMGPIVGGGRQRCWEILKRVSRFASCVVVVVAPTRDYERDSRSVVSAPNIEIQSFPMEGPAATNLMRQSSQATRWISEDGNRRAFDAIAVESFYMCGVLPSEMAHKAVLVEQNVESELIKQASLHRSAAWPTHGQGIAYADVCAAEDRVWRTVAQVVALSPEDAEVIAARTGGALHPRIVPNGWDHLRSPTFGARTVEGPVLNPRLLFVADYDYLPNLDGVFWLVHEVVPRVLAQLAGAQFIVGGINPPAELVNLLNRTEAVDWVGFVSDLPQMLGSVDAVVSPVRTGGGVRVKVTEAMFAGVPVISTSVGGWQWIPQSARAAIWIADTADEFAASIVALALSEDFRRDAKGALEQSVPNLPTWDKCVEELRQLWAC